jgi:hypothetical protein
MLVRNMYIMIVVIVLQSLLHKYLVSLIIALFILKIYNNIVILNYLAFDVLITCFVSFEHPN